MEKFPKFKEGVPKEELELIKPEEKEKVPPSYPFEIRQKLLAARKEKKLLRPEELPPLTPKEIKEKRWASPSEKYMEWLQAQKEMEELVEELLEEKTKKPKADIEKPEKNAAK